MAFVLLTVACGESGGTRKFNRGQGMAWNGGPYAGASVRVLDPNYNYMGAAGGSAAALAQRYPVRNDGLSEVAYLKNEPEFFAARMQMLDRAQISVRIQSLIFYADESSIILSNKLVELVNRGVRVDIIIDPVFNHSVKEHKMYFDLKRRGVHIHGYELLYLNWVNEITKVTDLEGLFKTSNMRYHEKLFIVDAENPSTTTAIIGGVNLANDYFEVDTQDPMKRYIDRDVMVRGPIVQDMTRAYDLTRSEFTRRSQEVDSSGSIWQTVKGMFSNSTGPITLSGANPAYMQTALAHASRTLDLNWQKVSIRFIQSRPRYNEDTIFPAIVNMIDDAQSEVLIVNSYLVPEKELIDAIGRAVRRGVKVKIQANTREVIETAQLVDLGRSRYKQLLALNQVFPGAVEIYEWGGFAKMNNGLGQNHGKYMVIDRKAVMIGSYNLDLRSRYLNSESVVVFEGVQTAQDYVTEFYRCIGPSLSLPVTVAEAEEYAAPSSVIDKLKLQVLQNFEIIF